MSAIESVSGSLIGILVAFMGLHMIYYFLGISTTSGQNVIVVAFMTVLSIVRTYLWRRLFNWLQRR